MSNLTPDVVATLQQVITATQANSFVYLTNEQAAPLVAHRFVIGNPAIVDANGSIAHRATPEGIAAAAAVAPAPVETAAAGWGNVPPVVSTVPVSAPSPYAPPAPPAAASPVGGAASPYATGSGFVRPEKRTRKPAGAAGVRTYPFESLEVNGYIFVPATEKRPDPKKSLASTIAGANKRFASFNPPRYFTTYRALKDQVFGNVVAPDNGAYIVRTDEPPAKKDAAE